MKKIIILILITILFYNNAHSFLIGDYSNIYNEEYFEYSEQTGINTLRMKTYYNEKYYNLPMGFPETGIQELKNRNMNILIWDNQAGLKSSPYYNNHANYYKFEAEYAFRTQDYPYKSSLNERNDWFYSFNHHKNVIIKDNHILLKPLKNDSLTVFDRLTIRENMPLMNETTPGYLNRFIYTFPIPLKEQTDLFINFRLKTKQIIDIHKPICKVGFKIAIDNYKGLNNFLCWDFDVSDLLKPTFADNKNNVLYHSDFQKNPDSDGYIEFEYKLNLNEIKEKIYQDMTQYKEHYLVNKNNPRLDLIPLQFFVNDNQKGREWRPIKNDELQISLRGGRINYFSPSLIYYNNSELHIDSIEIYDNLYKELPSKISAIEERLTYFDKFDNVIGFDAYDEPLAPSFKSFSIINDLIQNNRFLHTAITAFGHPKELEFNPKLDYSNIRHFVSSANPKIINPDPYLFGNEAADYNSANVNNPNHIQYLTDIVSKTYRATKIIAIEYDKLFMPIVHVYGKYNFTSNNWLKIMTPPIAQQKMLLYLPLCYGADGLWLFTLATEAHLDLSNSTGIRQVAPINVRNNNYEISFPQQLSVIRNSITNILLMQEILKNAQWLTGDTIKEKNTLISDNDRGFGLPFNINAYITADIADINYQGFVEYGLYKDNLNQVYIIFVNRRTNSKAKDFKDLPEKMRFDVNNAFITAKPQTINLELKDLPKSFIVSDILTKKELIKKPQGIYQIQLEAGEAILLKIGHK